MKHLIISDLHGSMRWQQIDPNLYGKIVFLGDYVSGSHQSDFGITENLKEIISFKRHFPLKVVLLTGAQDIPYLQLPCHQINDRRLEIRKTLKTIFTHYRNCFQLVYQHGNFLVSPAGITNHWYNDIMPFQPGLLSGRHNIAGLINKTARHITGIQHTADLYGTGSPLCATYRETSTDALQHYHQIVGHVPVPEIHTVSYPTRSITYINVLAGRPTFFETDLQLSTTNSYTAL